MKYLKMTQKTFISDKKDTGAVSLATNDDKQHKTHNNSVMLRRINLSLRSLKMMSLGRTIKRERIFHHSKFFSAGTDGLTTFCLF
jgi:hypothetical protein